MTGGRDANPIPRLDPYLEHLSLWLNVHASLIIALRDNLAPRLRPRYYVAVEERVVQAGPDELLFATRPDVSVVRDATNYLTATGVRPTDVAVITVEIPLPDELHQRFLAIRDVRGNQVVTVIEILSPANKRPGKGRQEYEHKRLEPLGSRTHLVEIDLLRDGPPMPMRGFGGSSDYRLLISRAPQRPMAALLPFSVRQSIPRFQLPLAPDDDEPEVDLNSRLHDLYDRAGYDLRIDYHDEPEPPLAGDDATWAAGLLQAAGLR